MRVGPTALTILFAVFKTKLPTFLNNPPPLVGLFVDNFLVSN